MGGMDEPVDRETDSIVGSARLEGGVVSATTVAAMTRVGRGDLDVDDAVAECIDRFVAADRELRRPVR